MTLIRTTKTAIAFALALQITAVGTMAQAQMISTDTAIERSAAQMDRASLMSELQKDDVRDEIIRLGVSPEEAEARLAALSDTEVKAMLRDIDEQRAGAGVVETIGTIFIILLVTDLLCLTRLFNFTRCVR
ncbi:MAG: PA2779 family protein [Pseudomonadota bacterium]